MRAAVRGAEEDGLNEKLADGVEREGEEEDGAVTLEGDVPRDEVAIQGGADDDTTPGGEAGIAEGCGEGLGAAQRGVWDSTPRV